MPHRALTQVGMNRVLWKLLALVGGRYEISNREVNTINPDVGIHIAHKQSTDTFTLSLVKVPKKVDSNIILLN